MTFRDSLAVIRERWLIVLLAVVLAVGGAAAVWFVRPPTYTATLTFYVSAQAVDSTQTAYQGGLLSQQRVKSYVELVRSTRVSEEVIKNLGLPDSPESVASQISASSMADSVLIDVAVTGRSPQLVATMANSVGVVFVRLVDELERPNKPDAMSPVAVRVVRPASVPTAPSSPGLPTMLALGLLCGLVLGVGGALTRNLLDTTVKSPEQLRAVAKAPNLAAIAFDPAVRKRPLTVHEGPQAPRAEAFRQLRTNLQFLDVDNRHKVLTVTSPLPNEGKTTTVLNLAIALASGGQRVLVIEADLRRPTGAYLLGLEGAVGLTSVLSGKVRIEQAIQQWSEGVDMLASGPLPPNPSELLGSNHMKVVLRDVRAWYDTVLIDTPPLLPVTDAAAVAPATDGAILVARYRKTTFEHVRRAVETLQAVTVPVLGTVFTMTPATGPAAYAQYNTRYQAVAPLTDLFGRGARPPVEAAASNGHDVLAEAAEGARHELPRRSRRSGTHSGRGRSLVRRGAN